MAKVWVFIVSIFLALSLPLEANKRKAPSFELPSIEGETVSLDSLLKVGPVVIDFWATWCKYCDDELDLLKKLKKEMGDTLFSLVGISVDSHRSISKVKAMAKAHRWDFPILLDTDGRVKEKFRVLALPTIFVVNEKGEIVLTRLGYNPSQERELKKIILQFVGSSKKD